MEHWDGGRSPYCKSFGFEDIEPIQWELTLGGEHSPVHVIGTSVCAER